LAAGEVRIGRRRFELLDKNIFDRRIAAGDAKRDALVVPQRNKRNAGDDEAFCVDAATFEMHEPIGAWYCVFQVRVVGEHRLTRGHAAACHCPIVRTILRLWGKW
jgi:hypothetical protein